jgi:hypothetical protein
MAALAQSGRGELLCSQKSLSEKNCSQKSLSEKSSSEESGVLVIDHARGKVLLRYAFVQLGTDDLVFPELVLDDWGHERKNLLLYRWVYENGYQFPRAELFGYDINGQEQQYFLRELDLQSRYPCFGYADYDMPLAEGIELSFIVIMREDSSQAELLKTGSEFDWPLRNAAVNWWQGPPGGAVKLAESLTMGKSTASFE